MIYNYILQSQLIKETTVAIVFFGFLGSANYIVRHLYNKKEDYVDELEVKKKYILELSIQLEKIQNDIDALKANYDL